MLFRRLKQIILILLLLAVIDAGIVLGFAFYQPEAEKADAIVILGAAINSPALYNRTLAGLKLYQEEKAPVIVLSGGKIAERDISEAGYMQKVINRTATQPVNMILEDQSDNTYDNIKNTRKKIPDAKSLIIVSDRFHIARAYLLARRNGFERVYWDSPQAKYYSVEEMSYYYFREMVAMIWYLPKFAFN